MIARRRFAAVCLCALVAGAPCSAIAQGDTPDTLQREPGRPYGFTSLDQQNTRKSVPGFSDLFRPLGGDFKRLFRPEHAGIAQLGILTAATFAPWDPKVRDTAWGGGTMHDVLKPGEVVGGAIFQSSAAFATWAVGRATNSPRVASLGADLVRAQIVSQTVTQAVKFSTHRTRPDGTTLSFPSGHTSSSFATATVLQSHFGLKAGIPAYAMAAWVATSRVQMKRHHVSDVLVGATVGVLAGRSVTFGRGAQRFSLSPMAVPGGAGISVVRIESR